jgi:hypothetical protein
MRRNRPPISRPLRSSRIQRPHECERQRYKGTSRLALLTSSQTNEGGELAIATLVTLDLDLHEERFGAPAVVLCPKLIGPERLLQRLVKWTRFVEGCAPLVRRLSCFGRSDTFSDGVSRQSGTLGYLMQRQLVAKIQQPNFAHHFHTDNPVFSCPKIEQK